MRRLLLLAALLAVATPARAQMLSVEMMSGSAYNVPTPLTIQQNGFPDLRIMARYDTRPFGPYAPYYSWRVTVWQGDQGWEFQQVHHRLFLSNTTAEIQAFAIHYGYNYFMIGHAWRRGAYVIHASGGLVITNPSSEIRGLSLNTQDSNALDAGYRRSGVGFGATLEREFRIASHIYLLGEGSILGGLAKVPVVDGSARVPTIGLHGRLGLGLQF
jgi:hypothetical protein